MILCKALILYMFMHIHKHILLYYYITGALAGLVLKIIHHVG
jgi:hypothetical protein